MHADKLYDVSLFVGQEAFSLTDEQRSNFQRRTRVPKDSCDEAEKEKRLKTRKQRRADVASREGRMRREVKIGHADVAWYLTKRGYPHSNHHDNVQCCCSLEQEKERAIQLGYVAVTNGTRRNKPQDSAEFPRARRRTNIFSRVRGERNLFSQEDQIRERDRAL